VRRKHHRLYESVRAHAHRGLSDDVPSRRGERRERDHHDALRRQRDLERRHRSDLLRIGGGRRTGGRMNWTVAAAFGLFLIGAAAALAQLWLRIWDPETFVKVMITLGVLLAVVIVWNLVQRERRDSARLRDKSKLQ